MKKKKRVGHDLGVINYLRARRALGLATLAEWNLTQPFPMFNPVQARLEIIRLKEVLHEMMTMPGGNKVDQEFDS